MVSSESSKWKYLVMSWEYLTKHYICLVWFIFSLFCTFYFANYHLSYMLYCVCSSTPKLIAAKKHFIPIQQTLVCTTNFVFVFKMYVREVYSNICTFKFDFKLKFKLNIRFVTYFYPLSLKNSKGRRISRIVCVLCYCHVLQ